MSGKIIKVDINKVVDIEIYNGKHFLGDLWLNSWSIHLVLCEDSSLKVSELRKNVEGFCLDAMVQVEEAVK